MRTTERLRRDVGSSPHRWLPFCRAHFRPFFVYLFGGIALALSAVAADPRAWASLLGLFLLGVASWPFLEYALHRGFHGRARSERMRALLYHAHLIHHERPHQTLVIRFSVSATVSLIFFFAFWGVLGSWPRAAALVSGVWAGYLSYEFMHFVAHRGEARRAWMRYMARYHRLHHQDARARFGVTTPWVDWLFRTHGSRTPGHEPHCRE